MLARPGDKLGVLVMEEEMNLVCLRYSVPVFLSAALASILFLFVAASTPFPWLDLLFLYVLVSATVTAAIFAFRTVIHGSGTTFNIFELGIAGLSASGMSLVVAVLGLFLSGIIDYIKGDPWIGELESPEEEIQRIVAELDLSENVYSDAVQLFEKVADFGLLKGRNISEIVPAIIYITARENNEPKTLEEVSEVARASKKEIGRAYRHIGRNTEIPIRPSHPADFLDDFASKMRLGDNVVERADEIVEGAVQSSVVSGKSPAGIAVSALYLASHIEGERRSMNDMSRTLGITTVTIRNRSKDLIDALGLEDYPEHLDS